MGGTSYSSTRKSALRLLDAQALIYVYKIRKKWEYFDIARKFFYPQMDINLLSFYIYVGVFFSSTDGCLLPSYIYVSVQV